MLKGLLVDLDTKEKEILDVACEYFLARGYHGTSLSAMARETGISKESLYRYYDSKEDLFLAVISKEIYAFNSRLPTEVPEFHDIRATLLDVGEALGTALNSDRTLALRRLVFQQATINPRIGQRYFAFGSHQADTVLKRIFTEHRSESDFNPEFLGHYFKSMISSRLMLERECRLRPILGDEELEKRVSRITDDFLAAFFRSHAEARNGLERPVDSTAV